jgi:hypothetical protein
MLPCSAKLSIDGEFMSITRYDGRILVVKMPSIIDPIQNEKPMENITTQQNELTTGFD